MAPTSKQVEDFTAIFDGNPTAYGADTTNGGVRCVRAAAAVGVEMHLLYGKPAGIYPMYKNQVKWGCTDIDTGSWEQAHNMYLILQRMELDPWIEISRSKGFHVWVFSNGGWVDAFVMRRAFLFAHHVSKQLGSHVPPTEVNPKAEWLEDDQLGNFVRLPYVGGVADENGRRVMVDDNGHPISIGTFLGAVQGASPNQLRYWADKYKAPRSVYESSEISSEEAKAIASRLNRRGFKIWSEGPPEWDERRSNTMARLSRECAASGLTQGEAFVLISDLDDRLQKWTNRSPEARDRARWSCVSWGYNLEAQ